MIARAAICPSPPLLAAGLSGQASVLPELLQACEAAVAWLLAAAPDEVTVVGPAAVTATWPPASAPGLAMHAPALGRTGRIGRPVSVLGRHGEAELIDDNSKKPPPGPASARVGAADVPSAGRASASVGSAINPRSAEAPLPLALSIGAELLDAAGYLGPRVLQSIADSAAPGDCYRLGLDLAADAPRTALLVMGDGTARRSAAAPGYLDDRAEPFDTAVEQALRDGDLAALAALDPALARDLLAAGRPAWQVLAGALAPQPAATADAADAAAPPPGLTTARADLAPPARPRTRILYSAAPLGVAYLVATLDPTATT